MRTLSSWLRTGKVIRTARVHNIHLKKSTDERRKRTKAAAATLALQLWKPENMWWLCQVRLPQWTVPAILALLILLPEGARITKASHFDYEYVLGHKIVFICVATGKPRPKIIWFKDGRELYDHHYLHISEWYKGKRRLKSKMEIDPATQGDAGIYECHANNKWS